jgi:hypothetical protein
MRTATGNFDDELRATLFARLPERLDDAQRRRKYDEPLTAMIAEAGLGTFIRGFSQVGNDGQIAWVGIEVTLVVMQNWTFVVQRLVELGAPLETRVEMETMKATLEFTLAEWTGG